MNSEELEKNFLDLYNAESDAIFRYCYLRTSDREQALDLTQDTFVRFWSSLTRNQDISNYRAFLFAIARNLVIDWYRKKKSISLEALAEEAGVDIEMFLGTGSERDLELEADAAYIVKKIGELEPLYQQAVYLRFVEDLKPKEIAEILGESPNTISVRINRGLEKLRMIAGMKDEQLS